ncbi:hypothetical protein [Polynucleobacter yangtzensis]|uniref:HNH endonuclease n=1 Tax=Polynucleobacter yangtzensis TaxID=1743159 RepID=A0ABM8CN12_9BURK|nr:hypothetical protein [Polynucleobacter yangtzensis]BDT79220.1 hypothetical protein PKF032_11080 [Polynucleobacter yangtzensis]
MSNKTCSKCQESKPLEMFRKNKTNKDGYSYECKVCCSARDKVYYKTNKEKVNVLSKAYYEANKDKLNIQRKVYREANKGKVKSINKAYYEANKDKIKAQNKAYYETNKDKVRATQIARKGANKERYLAKRMSYISSRQKLDKLYELKNILRACVWKSFNRVGYTKKSKTNQILGADWSTVKAHFESQFKDGMSWENMGEWHIDHIIPMALAKTEEDAIKLNHYTNLRPLWAKDNLSKRDALPSNDELHQYGIDWLLKEIAA